MIVEETFNKRDAIRRIIAHEEKIFEIFNEERIPYKSYARYNREKNIDIHSISHSEKLSLSDDYKFYFNVNNLSEKIINIDFLPNNCFSLLVNKKGLDFISELCPNEFEYFDTIIETKNGIITDYKLVNILVSAEIADKNKTTYLIVANNCACGYKKLVAKYNPLEGHNIARDIKNGYVSSGIYISPLFKSEYKKRKLKGVSFEDAEFPSMYMSSYEFYNPNTGVWEGWK